MRTKDRALRGPREPRTGFQHQLWLRHSLHVLPGNGTAFTYCQETAVRGRLAGECETAALVRHLLVFRDS